MKLYIRRQSAGPGFVVHDKAGHSAGGSTIEAARRTFSKRYPEIYQQIDQVEMADGLVGESFGDVPEQDPQHNTPEQDARFQAMLDGKLGPDHTHDEEGRPLSQIIALIHGLAGRVERIEHALLGDNVPVPNGHAGEAPLISDTTIEAVPDQSAYVTYLEGQLKEIHERLSNGWRDFVFEPGVAEAALMGIVPLIESLVLHGPATLTLESIEKWFESLGTLKDDAKEVYGFVCNSMPLPLGVDEAAMRLFGER